MTASRSSSDSAPDSAPGPLPEAVQAWLDDHPEVDAAPIREVWQLAGQAQREIEVDEVRVETIRDRLHRLATGEVDAEEREAVREEVGQEAAGVSKTRDRDRASRQNHRPAQTGSLLDRLASSWARLGAVAGAVVCAVVIGLVAYGAVPVAVTAPPGQIRTVTLTDGSQADLNSGTTLRYDRWTQVAGALQRWTPRGWVPDAWMRPTVVLDGEAFFDVRAASRAFVVRTDNARAEVVGTQFNVRARRDGGTLETRVTVAEGRVDVTASGATTRVDSAEAAVVRGVTEPGPAEAASPGRVTAWRRGGVAFTGAPLRVVAAELERRFDVRIEVAPDVDARSVSLTVPNPHDPAVLLQDVCAVAGCRVDDTGEGLAVRPR